MRLGQQQPIEAVENSGLAPAATGTVPWWPAEDAEVTLHQMIVLMIGETNRHGGHADIVRELIDGTAGLRPDFGGLPEGDGAWWADYRARLEHTARNAAGQ